MANKDQNKRTDNKNKPKLTVKEKKERGRKGVRNQIDGR